MAAVCLSLLAVAAPARAAEISFEGHVLDEAKTAFELTAKFRHGRPVALRSFESGRVTVSCETGSRMKRTSLNLPPSVPGTLRKDGAFSWTNHYVQIETGEEFRRDRVTGIFGTESASGTMHIRLSTKPNRGSCKTQRLDWAAQRTSGASRMNAEESTPRDPRSDFRAGEMDHEFRLRRR
jgi:hypothetical protein